MGKFDSCSDAWAYLGFHWRNFHFLSDGFICDPGRGDKPLTKLAPNAMIDVASRNGSNSPTKI